MQLRVLSSGSIGNCYLLEATNTTLILEVGVSFKQIKEALRFNLKRVCGALITHEHKDHCKGIKECLEAGVSVYTSAGTIKAMGLNSNRLNVIKAGVVQHIGEFKILPFAVKHDVNEPLGFLIHHPECGNVLFVTDSIYLNYKFPNLHNVIIEANFCIDIMQKKFYAGSLNGYVMNRNLVSHMSIIDCKKMLSNNDLTAVNNIVLIHLSDSNSDAARFQKEVSSETGKTVYIAEKGLSIPFNKTPF